jgi:hypothetical protein
LSRCWVWLQSETVKIAAVWKSLRVIERSGGNIEFDLLNNASGRAPILAVVGQAQYSRHLLPRYWNVNQQSSMVAVKPRHVSTSFQHHQFERRPMYYNLAAGVMHAFS